MAAAIALGSHFWGRSCRRSGERQRWRSTERGGEDRQVGVRPNPIKATNEAGAGAYSSLSRPGSRSPDERQRSIARHAAGL